jgi:hypothetical protein
MFDFMNMAGSPQAREMLFKMMSRQMGNVPPDVREAISKVEVSIKRNERGFELHLGQSENARVEKMLKESTDNWIELLSRGFQAVGYRVNLSESSQSDACPIHGIPGFFRMFYEMTLCEDSLVQISYLIQRDTPDEPIMPSKEWRIKPSEYAAAQDKKWQRWNEAMFEKVN